MAQFKAQTTNTNNVWNASKRYKINSVVTHSGIEYLNITGSNSLPTLGNDWLVCRQPIGPTYTQSETDALLLAKLSKNPAEYTVATLPLTGTELALVEQGGTFKKVEVSDLASNKLDKVTTNDVEKVYIKNADGTQGMKPVSEFGGGGGDFIPRGGTIDGLPVTGDIKIEGDIFINALNTTGLYVSSNDNVVSLKRGDNQFLIQDENAMVVDMPVTARGLSGSQDFTSNIADLDYVQKKYVDAKVADNLTASTTVAPSKTAVNTALSGKQDNITLTTTGTSGVATLVGNTLNIPNYASGGGATNLTYTPSATNGIVNSDTGTDATIPLANGTNAGLSLNDYTTAEKNKVALLSGTNTGDNAVNSNYASDYRASNFVAGIDYALPNANTTGTASNITDSSNSSLTSIPNLVIGQSQVTNLTTDLANNATNDRNRGNHTGTQTASTISDFNASVLNLTLAKSKAVYQWTLTTATGGIWMGTAGAGAGTYTTALPTDTNLYTSTKRARYANVVTTLNQVLGQRNTEAIFYRGSAVSGAGGFKFFARGGFDVWTNGSRFFAGMASGTTVISANPSLLANTVGFAVDNADNGLIYFITRDASTVTRVSTGLTIVSNKGYDFNISCVAGGTSYIWSITDLNTGTTASGTATLTLPVNNTKLTANFLASNGALTPVTSTQLGLCKMTIETDY